MYRKRNSIIELVFCLIDLAFGMMSLFLAGMIRYGSIKRFLSTVDMLLLFFVILIAHIAVYYAFKEYNGFYTRNRYQELAVSIRYNIVLVAIVVLFGFVIKNDMFVSRLVTAYFGIINVVLIWIVHIFIRNVAKRLSRRLRRQRGILIVTTAEKTDEVVDRFNASKQVAWSIEGIVLFDEKPEEGEMRGEIPVISMEEDDYLDFATNHIVDEVFIYVEGIQRRENELKKMILGFEEMGIVVNMNVDLFGIGGRGSRQIYTLEQYQVVAFSNRLFDYRAMFVKRLIDIVGSLIGMVITIIVGIVLAPFILLGSKGPLIFRQDRVGVNGRIFKFYKFRSMYVDAEERKKELLDKNEVEGPMFKIENDPRVTKVGAFIRRTSLDELPQFWNVLKGDMSLVGTRPPTVDEYEQYNYRQKRRISCKPGMTGLWQISGRSDIKNFDEVVKLDLEYIDNWSVASDIRILFKTFAAVFRRRGAK